MSANKANETVYTGNLGSLSQYILAPGAHTQQLMANARACWYVG